MNRIWPWLAGLVILLVIGGAYLISLTPVEVERAAGEQPVEALSMPTQSEWVLSEPDARGLQFVYPQELPMRYIRAPEWPPRVLLIAGEYSCAEADERIIGDRTYCVAITSEGAAGSAYRTYEYISGQGDALAHVRLTLQFPQCANYDEPEREACVREQASFDIDGLVDRITASIRML